MRRSGYILHPLVRAMFEIMYIVVVLFIVRSHCLEMYCSLESKDFEQ